MVIKIPYRLRLSDTAAAVVNKIPDDLSFERLGYTAFFLCQDLHRCHRRTEFIRLSEKNTFSGGFSLDNIYCAQYNHAKEMKGVQEDGKNIQPADRRI